MNMPSLPPRPGWYPDPVDGRVSRYWDGIRWTDVTATQPAAWKAVPPQPQMPPGGGWTPPKRRINAGWVAAGWVAIFGIVVGIGIGGFQYYKTHSKWYQAGYEAANTETTKALVYARGAIGPFQFCSAQRTMASLSGADETGKNWVVDGCIAGLKDLLGSAEYERLLRSG